MTRSFLTIIYCSAQAINIQFLRRFKQRSSVHWVANQLHRRQIEDYSVGSYPSSINSFISILYSNRSTTTQCLDDQRWVWSSYGLKVAPHAAPYGTYEIWIIESRQFDHCCFSFPCRFYSYLWFYPGSLLLHQCSPSQWNPSSINQTYSSSQSESCQSDSFPSDQWILIVYVWFH